MRPFSRSLPMGAAFWVCFSLVAVLCRGVRWDETYEHAQVLAGWVVYPPWHPLPRYVAGVFSLQTRLSGWILAWGGNAVLLCGFRNVLFLSATILSVFLFTSSLTGKTHWGHLAALLMLQGTFLEFDGSYPTFVWPELYSNGHIGGGFALFTVWALIFGYPRLGGLLLGLMPAIHLGQYPPVLALAGGMAALALLRAGCASARRHLPPVPPCSFRVLMPYLAAGLLLSLGTWLLTYTASVAQGAEAAQSLWRSYTFHHDPHRRFPPGNGHIILAGTLLLAALRGRKQPDRGWITVYVAIIAGLTWGTMILHAVLGDRLPFLFIVWMPYRLINHIPPLCMALIAATLARGQRGAWLLPAGLAACLLVAHPGALGDNAVYTRYLAHGEWLAFFLFGAALVQAAGGGVRRRFTVVVLAVTGLMPFHQFGAVCFLAGAMTQGHAHRRPCSGIRLLERPALTCAVAGLATILLLVQQAKQHDWLPISPIQRAIATETEKDAMLLGPPDSCMIQARTGHPVLAEAATASFISYLPELGPVIDALYRDCYGITFAVPRPEGFDTPWMAVWEGRDEKDWSALAARYGFDYILAPEGVSPPLPPVRESRGEGVLYRAPRAEIPGQQNIPEKR